MPSLLQGTKNNFEKEIFEFNISVFQEQNIKMSTEYQSVHKLSTKCLVLSNV